MKLAFALWFGLATIVAAADPVPVRTFQVHPLLFADGTLAAEQAKAIVGTDGRVTLDVPNNRLVVIATVKEHAQIAGLIKELSVPPRNIKIEVRITEAGQSSERGLGGTVDGAAILPGGPVHIGGRIIVQDQTLDEMRNTAQFITVTTGKRGAISVGEEVPFLDWFFDYGVRGGYLQPAFRWERVGSRLLVEPRVVGNDEWIQVKLIPEFSYFADGKPGTIAFINAATEVTVANGQKFHVGGAAKDQEFYRRFLVGGSRASQVRNVDIVLKPTILP
jgi:type II secretory pathway component GspD/PulD (secretin)